MQSRLASLLAAARSLMVKPNAGGDPPIALATLFRSPVVVVALRRPG
jgi:hypothetical protein